tara:strand:+ start:485 stop:691 length:207 start_codon:yes stop_codon:yes gene_type:complete
MRYINYRNDDNTIETVEDFGLLVKGNIDRRSRRNILEEYKLADSRYYGSNRASKAHYESLKQDKEEKL